jgi:hypothetical protein
VKAFAISLSLYSIEFLEFRGSHICCSGLRWICELLRCLFYNPDF